MENLENKFDEFIEHIKNDVPFSFSRWGDGEWTALLKLKPGEANCDKHEYFSSLSTELERVLLSRPNYYLGMQGHAIRTIGDPIINFLDAHELHSLNWVDSDLFHKASIKGQFERFLEAIEDKDCILIGNESLLPMTEAYKKYRGIRELIHIPAVNCWEDRVGIQNRIEDFISMVGNINIKFLFSASMMSNVLINDLYNSFGHYHSFIDMGSVFEPYVGLSIRGYHKDIVKRLEE